MYAQGGDSNILLWCVLWVLMRGHVHIHDTFVTFVLALALDQSPAVSPITFVSWWKLVAFSCPARLSHTMAAAKEARYISITTWRDDGTSEPAVLKVWNLGAAEPLRWELRRAIDAARLRCPSHFLHKFIKLRKDEWRAVLATYGVEYDDAIFPSRQSAKAVQAARGEEHAPDDLQGLQQEWSVTTEGLIVILMHAAGSARKADRRTGATNVLQAILAAGCTDEILSVGGMLTEVPGAIAAQCAIGAPAEGDVCEHVGPVVVSLAQGDGRVQHRLAAALIKLHTLALNPVCPAAASVSRRILSAIHQCMKQVLPTQGHTDVRKAMVDDPVVMHSAKRRRVDEDLKDYIVKKAAGRDGCTHSSRSYVKITGVAAGSTATYWDTDFLLEHQQACWSTFSNATAVHVSLDSTRIGNPKEDTELVVAWDFASKKGCVLPPQVPMLD